ncbi:MAG TPA: GNAT family N-acetyltransferase [Terriglobia bacterium]|nr:GNAT family N-acetyltransferase [Terriglobia bacterium]
MRLLETHREFRECEAAQKSIWGGLAASAEVMLVAQKTGGAVLGAFVNGKLAGFLFALLARRNGKIIHWSHMMGVLPEYRDRGLGFQLKLAHRRIALSQGIKSICWTYDPLQSRNASLNISRLGALVEEYVVDYYGRFPSMIEKGLPSDRFVVNWQIASRHVERCLAERNRERNVPNAPVINSTSRTDRGLLLNRKIDLSHQEARLLVEIPSNTDDMRTKALRLARSWRLQTRKIFLAYLSNGYRVANFFTRSEGSCGPRCFYLLQRN